MHLSLMYFWWSIKRPLFVAAASITLAGLLGGCSSSRPSATGWGGRVEKSDVASEKVADLQPDDSSAADPASPEAAEILPDPRPVALITAQSELLGILSAELELWMGTPHVFGGTSLSGVDCSALIQAVFRDALNVSLPRTTFELENIGESVARSALQTGDLVFFRPDGAGRHAGIYMGNHDFIHSSSSRGVMRSNLDEPYWDRFYHKARRVFVTGDQLIEAVAYAHRMAKIRADFQSN